MAKIGKLNNCLTICDVLDSMTWIPMEVSVALGLLVSELMYRSVYPPGHPSLGTGRSFFNCGMEKLIYSAKVPSFRLSRVLTEGEDKVCEVGKKVFDLLLHVAVDGKLNPVPMIKRLFIFQ
ncbi:hypothetical protein STAS_05535 [Striga asiatica]|uniref:Uncharacterized protein n=1 Tax=Striga asiatica TaxID=4170 RepID=A0A5A7P9Y0_STRAF|nr:hypothetical protein STAS_05535 [Striga asiatica]